MAQHRSSRSRTKHPGKPTRPAPVAAARGRVKQPTVEGEPTEPGKAGPEVIVDFLFEEGLLYVVLQNISDTPAYDVRTGFDPPFRGLGGEQETSALRMFRHTPFLAPRRSIRSLLDSSASYFQRGEPRSITASLTYRDADRRKYARTILHDLAIYEDLAFVARSAPSGSSETSNR
jgi:hypothetical protein